MKKISLVFLAFIILIFILPAILTKGKLFAKAENNNKETLASQETGKNQGQENKEGKEDKGNQENSNNSQESQGKENINEYENLDKSNYDYKEYSTIKLLHKASNEVEELPMDEYLLGVVSSEMPATFEQEALKAQAVVARTYTIYSIKNNRGKHEGADICDDSNCCQAWITKENRLARWEEDVREENWKKIEIAVYSTRGKVITYEGEVIDAFFHSNSGGVTETPVGVWGGTNYPYLQSVETAGEDAYSQYSSEISLSKQEFKDKIMEKHKDLKLDFENEDCIKIIDYTESNRVKTLKVGNLSLSGVEIRTTLGLKSTNFTVNIDENNVNFKVTGYGHGVGMSQTGADSMAKSGSGYEEIIKHFYSGVEVIDM